MGYDMHHRKSGDGEDGYFRLNVWGMAEYRKHMLHTGMAFMVESAIPPWPECEDYGIAYEDYAAVKYADDSDYDSHREAMTSKAQAKVAKYIADLEKVLRWHGDKGFGIPVHKFSTNDGWIVTPDECRDAMRIWRSGGAKPLPGHSDAVDYWNRWIKFLELAAERDGFEVH